MRAANFASVRPRLPAAQVLQPFGSSKAFRAASTARSTSALPPSGAVAMTLAVAGFTISNVWPSAASTVWPPITIFRALMPDAVWSMAIEEPRFNGRRRGRGAPRRVGRT